MPNVLFTRLFKRLNDNHDWRARRIVKYHLKSNDEFDLLDANENRIATLKGIELRMLLRECEVELEKMNL